MSDSTYLMGKRYAEVIKTIWFTFLYATLVPAGTLITLFGLIFYYWIDKYNLLRRSTIKSNISGKLALVSMKLLDFSLILMPIGSIIFDDPIRHTVHWSTIVMSCIGLIYMFIPMDKLLDYLHKEDYIQ